MKGLRLPTGNGTVIGWQQVIKQWVGQTTYASPVLWAIRFPHNILGLGHGGAYTANMSGGVTNFDITTAGYGYWAKNSGSFTEYGTAWFVMALGY